MCISCGYFLPTSHFASKCELTTPSVSHEFEVILFTVNFDQFIVSKNPLLVPRHYCTVSAYLVQLFIPNLQL